MKAYVITITDLDLSVKTAQRCIESARNVGINVELFTAITPKDDLEKLCNAEKIDRRLFNSKYSRKENTTACFLSHYFLWRRCIELNETLLILEHDAVFISPLENFSFDKLVSIGKPSFGTYNTPTRGLGPLVSKDFLPGAHAYLLKPEGAMALIKQASQRAAPADVFMNKNDFPWIQEYYPWPVEVQDTFTTVQKEEGCKAKHNYNSKYEII